MFKMLGILVLFYTFYGAHKGEIYAKSGVWGKTISKAESPNYFWSVIAIYTGLGLALIFLF
jgi:hypothetical protein